MNHSFSKPEKLWAIVLAGGEGTRMGSLTRRWLGYSRPKQYCTFFGDKSLLASTLDRMSRLVGPERTVTVIGRGHDRFLRDEPALPGHRLEQPAARGTGAGVFFPVSYIYGLDPDATVIIAPSDHFISPEGPFRDTLLRAAGALDCPNHSIILLGARPDRAEPEYGWIRPGPEPACSRTHPELRCRTIREFVEKPEPRLAARYFGRDYLWNTMIAVAKVKALWTLGQILHRKALVRFERLLDSAIVRSDLAGGRQPDSGALEREYSEMDCFDFSRDFLARCTGQCLAVPMDGVLWSDLGRPNRVMDLLKRVGYRPNFPVELAEDQHYRL